MYAHGASSLILHNSSGSTSEASEAKTYRKKVLIFSRIIWISSSISAKKNPFFQKNEGVTYNVNLSVRTVQNDFHLFLSFANKVYVLWKSRLCLWKSSLRFKESSLRFVEIKFAFSEIKIMFCGNLVCVSKNQDCVFRNQDYVSKNPVCTNHWMSLTVHGTSFCFGLRTVPTNSKVFLRGLLTMREKQILTSVIKIQKENWG